MKKPNPDSLRNQTVISVRVPANVRARLEALSKAKHLSMNALITGMIETALRAEKEK